MTNPETTPYTGAPHNTTPVAAAVAEATETPPTDDSGTVDYYDFVDTLFMRHELVENEVTHALLGMQTEAHELENHTDDRNFFNDTATTEIYTVAAIQSCLRALGKGRADLIDIVQGYDNQFDAALTNKTWDQHHQFWKDKLNDLLDVAKKWVGCHGRPSDERLQQMIAEVGIIASGLIYSTPASAEISRLTSPFDGSVHRYAGLAKQANFAKLSARYKDKKFSLEAASRENRDHAAEDAAVAAVVG